MSKAASRARAKARSEKGAVPGWLGAFAALALPVVMYYLLYMARLGEAHRYRFSEYVISLDFVDAFGFLIPALTIAVVMASYALFLVCIGGSSRAFRLLRLLLGFVLGLAVGGWALSQKLLFSVGLHWMVIGYCCIYFVAFSVAAVAFSSYFGRTAASRAGKDEVGRRAKLKSKIEGIRVWARENATMPLAGFCCGVALFAYAIGASAAFLTDLGSFEPSIVFLTVVITLFLVAAILSHQIVEFWAKARTLFEKPLFLSMTMLLIVALSGFLMVDLGGKFSLHQAPSHPILSKADNDIGASTVSDEKWCVLTTFGGNRAVVRKAVPAGPGESSFKVDLDEDYDVIYLADGAYHIGQAIVDFEGGEGASLEARLDAG